MIIILSFLLFADLKVGVIESKPMAYQEDGVYKGYAVDVIKEFNDNIVFVPSDINNVFRDVSSGKLDVAIGSLSVTSEREKLVDFTHPVYLNGGLTIISKNNKKFGLSKGAWKAMWIFFPYIFISSIIFWSVERGKCLPRNLKDAFWSSVWFIDALFSTRGWGDIVPKSVAGKITALIIGMIGIVLYSYFNSFITVSSLSSSSYDIEDLKGKIVYTKANTTADNYLNFSGLKYKKCLTIDECYDKLVSNKADAVVFDAPSVLHFAKEHSGELVVGETLQQEAYSFAVSEKELEEDLNIAILQLYENGKLEKIKNKWFGF